MNELDTRAERFLESIRAEGEAACAAIRTETDAEIERQLEETRKAQQTKAEHTLHFETDRAHTRANRELSAARMQARAKLAAQRQQIAADTFAAARTQLAAFAAGKDYMFTILGKRLHTINNLLCRHFLVSLEIRITERAFEVTTTESDKDCSTTTESTFTLQRVEDFVYSICFHICFVLE